MVLITNAGSEYANTAQAIIPFENDVTADIIFIPNVFTPNGDGKNDYFEISGINNFCADTSKLTILNRWGKKVFEAEGNQFSWDGRSNSDVLASGTYFFILEGEGYRKSGSVTLMR